MAKSWEIQDTEWESWSLPWGSHEVSVLRTITELVGSRGETVVELEGSLD